MHYILTPAGSFGDVLPFVGIGRELHLRGHDVVLFTAEPFRDATVHAGLRFVSGWSQEDYDRVTRDPDIWHPTRGLQLILEAVRSNMRQAYATLTELCTPSTVLIGHPLAFATRMLEETQQLRAVTLHLAPSAFRSDFRQPVMRLGWDLSDTPRWLKRVLWWIIDRAVLDPRIVPALNAWRAELDLPPVRRLFDSWMHSPQRLIGLFPEWFGPPQPDWPPQLRLTGFPLFDDAGRDPDPDVQGFIDEAEPPIVVTPGSGNRQARAFFEVAIRTCELTGHRTLLVTPYPEQLPGELPSRVHSAAYVPFSTLLPRCALLVHHGGIGTCAQAIAAGVPQLIMPMAYDQPDNATRVARLNLGLALAPRRFSKERVAKTLEVLLTNDEIARACRAHRAMITTQNAIHETCDLIEAA